MQLLGELAGLAAVAPDEVEAPEPIEDLLAPGAFLWPVAELLDAMVVALQDARAVALGGDEAGGQRQPQIQLALAPLAVVQ